MNSTAQLPGVNRPLSVELRLINFCSCGFDSQEENHTARGRLLLTKRSDFPGAEGLVLCSPFGGLESLSSREAIGGSLKKENDGAETPDSAMTKEYLSFESGWNERSEAAKAARVHG